MSTSPLYVDFETWLSWLYVSDASDSDEGANKSGLKAGSRLFGLNTGQIETDSKFHSG